MAQYTNLTIDKVPFVKLEFDFSLANLNGEQPYKALILGETKVTVTEKKPIRITDKEIAATKFGKDSAIYQMVDLFTKINKSTPLYVFPFTATAASDLAETKPGDAASEAADSFQNRLAVLKEAGQFNIVISEWNDLDRLKILGDFYETMATADIAAEGLLFTAVYGTLAEIVKFNEDKKLNCRFITCMASPQLKFSDDTKVPPYLLATAEAAVVAVEAQAAPGRPFNGLPLLGIPPYDRETGYTRAQLNTLIKEGFSVYSLNGDGAPEILWLVTTYTQDSSGTPDDSFQNINDFFISSRLRFRFVSYFYKKYIAQRYMLAGDDDPVPAGKPILQPKFAKAEGNTIFEQWQQEGLVKNARIFQESLQVEYTQKGVIEFSFRTAYIDQLRGIAGKLFLVGG